MKEDNKKFELRVGEKYQLGKPIGSGSFGQIYLGTDILNGEEVAIKLERLNAKRPQLHMECKFYKIANGTRGFPSLKWSGVEGDFNVMVIDLLGPNLEELFAYCGNRFSLKTTVMLAEQMLSTLEFIHNKQYIHRDIKPGNFLMGFGRNSKIVYLIDFGLAKKFEDFQTKKHIPYKEGKRLTGTPRYSSINNHLGIEQSRRDDLESLAYVIIYFVRGNLPWQGLRGITKRQKLEKIANKKISCSIDELCINQPIQLADFLKYCRKISFDEKPNYEYLKRLLYIIFLDHGYENDKVYDWTLKYNR